MGGKTSKADNNGEVVNNIVIENVDVKSSTLLILITIILFMAVLHFFISVFVHHKRKLRKVYLSRPRMDV